MSRSQSSLLVLTPLTLADGEGLGSALPARLRL